MTTDIIRPDGEQSKEEIDIFEAGFCDRVIASRIFSITGAFSGGIETAKYFIKEQKESVRKALDDILKHYRDLLSTL